jgi:endonuclease YncB( thermonuclease family)
MIVGQPPDSSYGTVSVSRIVRVIDGDTFVVDIDEFPDLIGKQISIRVNGIDTPELRGKCDNEKILAVKAKERVEALLKASDTIMLENLSRGSFFRIVADVIIDGVSLGEIILNEDLATPYRPGSEPPWCTGN